LRRPREFRSAVLPSRLLARTPRKTCTAYTLLDMRPTRAVKVHSRELHQQLLPLRPPLRQKFLPRTARRVAANSPLKAAELPGSALRLHGTQFSAPRRIPAHGSSG